MIGIKAYGAYVPRLRLDRKTVAQANAWYAPGLLGKVRGTRAMANWDEDTITMAVAAARNCLGSSDDRSHIEAALLASTTFPFADRLNSGLMSAALTLNDTVDAVDLGGSQRAAISAVAQALTRVQAGADNVLVAGADRRKTNAASAQELAFGDGAAALLLGSGDVIAEFLGSSVMTDDFVDHFRACDQDVDYQWEERWIRDEGISKLVPQAVQGVLQKTGVDASAINHFIFPTTFKKLDLQLAKRCGLSAATIADNLADTVGDIGVPHGLLMLAHTLETAKTGDLVLLTQFGQGAEALLFRVTDKLANFAPKKTVSEQIQSGVEETSYTRFLAYNGKLQLEKGMRGEQDKKTALSTQYRHRKMLTGFIAGQCQETGEVHFPPTRLSYTQGKPQLDTQKPYKLADRRAKIVSLSADYLSFSMSPPNQYGLVDFVGGGRLLMEFTDVATGDVETGTEMEMVFRIKDVDSQRAFKRYFWKATPIKTKVKG